MKLKKLFGMLPLVLTLGFPISTMISRMKWRIFIK